MKSLILVFVYLIVTTSFASTADNSARVGTRYAHVFVGLGEAYSPVDFRTGGENYELGIFQGKILGAVSLVELSPHFYMALGGGLYLGDSALKNISFYAGVGADFWHWWFFNFRSEVGMYSNISNYTGGKINFGINVGF